MKRVFLVVAILSLLLPQTLFLSNPSLDKCCGRQLGLDILGVASASSYVNVLVSEAKQMIESNPNLVILDVRGQAEYDSGHLPNATLIPVNDLDRRLYELDRQKDILVYCGVGSRSANASQILVDNGFQSVYNMLGGITSWKNAGYWIEIVHDGDLIIGGTQTLIIENCTYAQKGNVIVSANANMIIHNAVFRIGPQEYWHQFHFTVNDQARLGMSSSTIDVPKGATLECAGNSRVNISESLLEGIGLTASGGSTITLNDTTCESGINLWDDFKMTILNSTTTKITLNLAPPYSHQIMGLRPGYFDYLNLRQNQSEVAVGWQLTMSNSSVGNWGLDLERSYVNVAVSDSALGSIWITYSGTTGQINGVKDGTYYEHLDIDGLELTNTSVADFSFAIRNSIVEVRNTTALLHMFEGMSSASIYDSDVIFFSRGARETEATGVLLLNNSLLSIEGLAYSELYVSGNLTHKWSGGDWFMSNVSRNYSVIARDSHGDFIENAALALFEPNGSVVWSGHTDSLGNADFNLTFTDMNYTDQLRLEAIKDGASATQSVSLLSSTPVQLQMLRHDIAIASIIAYRMFVGQGFDALLNVTVTNQGDTSETFNFTLYANGTALENHTITYLLPGLNRSTTFIWNTTGLAYGNYTIYAVASPLELEADTADNNYTCWVIITLVGDITGQGGSPDGNVDMKDVSYVARRFLCLQSDPLWDPNADINGDIKIDMKDIAVPARHFGEHYP